MPPDQYYGEIHPSRQLTLSNLRALEESLRTTPSKGIVPSIRSVTSTSFPDSPPSEKEFILTLSHLSKHCLSTMDPPPQHPFPTPFNGIRTMPFVPYSFPSTEHWKSMTATRWKAILARTRWNLNILIGQEATEALRGEIPCGEYWKVEARHSGLHNACLAATQEEKESRGQGSSSFDPGRTPRSQPPQRQLATRSKNSERRRRRRPWYRRLFALLDAIRICKAVNVPQAHDTEEEDEEEEEEPVRFSIRSRKYWQTEAVFYASHEAKVMLSRGYKEFAQKNLPPDARV